MKYHTRLGFSGERHNALTDCATRANEVLTPQTNYSLYTLNVLIIVVVVCFRCYCYIYYCFCFQRSDSISP